MSPQDRLKIMFASESLKYSFIQTRTTSAGQLKNQIYSRPVPPANPKTLLRPRSGAGTAAARPVGLAGAARNRGEGPDPALFFNVTPPGLPGPRGRTATSAAVHSPKLFSERCVVGFCPSARVQLPRDCRKDPKTRQCDGISNNCP